MSQRGPNTCLSLRRRHGSGKRAMYRWASGRAEKRASGGLMGAFFAEATWHRRACHGGSHQAVSRARLQVQGSGGGAYMRRTRRHPIAPPRPCGASDGPLLQCICKEPGPRAKVLLVLSARAGQGARAGLLRCYKRCDSGRTAGRALGAHQPAQPSDAMKGRRRAAGTAGWPGARSVCGNASIITQA